jgi:hypothetical protein
LKKILTDKDLLYILSSCVAATAETIMNEILPQNMIGIIRATGIRKIFLLLSLIVGSLKLPGLIMP